MDNSALVPDNYQLDAEPIQKIEAEAIQSAQIEDRELAALQVNSGFIKLSKDMKSDINKFKTGEFIKDVESKSLEEVGKLFVIHQSVATFLQSYLDKVDNAAKAVADAERART